MRRTETIPIIQAPDALLLCISESLDSVRTSDRMMIEEIRLAMTAAKDGIALSGVQIGWPKRVAVFHPHFSETGVKVMVNPEIVERSDSMAPSREGCLSIEHGVPRFMVPRHVGIRVRWSGRDNGEREQFFHGFAAAVIQHELDHMQGVLLTAHGRLVK